MRKIIGFIVVLVFVTSSAHAEGRGFFSLGAALNRSDGLIDASVPLMPHVSIEGAFPIGTGPFSVGYELSALIYRNHTTRWGSETGVGFLVGPAFSLDINESWTLSSGGGS